MNKALLSIAVLIVSLAVFSARTVQAAERAPATASAKAATDELPLAFRALGGDASQVVDQDRAQQVRGQWWIYLPMQSGDIFFQGMGGGFRMHLATESQTVPDYWVGLRFTIGR